METHDLHVDAGDGSQRRAVKLRCLPCCSRVSVGNKTTQLECRDSFRYHWQRSSCARRQAALTDVVGELGTGSVAGRSAFHLPMWSDHGASLLGGLDGMSMEETIPPPRQQRETILESFLRDAYLSGGLRSSRRECGLLDAATRQ